MDVSLILTAIGAATWQAGLSQLAARDAKADAERAIRASATLAAIEMDRRRAELTPKFRITAKPTNLGIEALRLRIALLGPPGLDHLDHLTVRIRDDDFRRGDGMPLAGGPTREQIKAQIWGPYMFTPGTGPDEARADPTGRVTDYTTRLPVGEELLFSLDPTIRPSWATATSPSDWRRECGTVIRLTLEARNDSYGDIGAWVLPAEIDTAECGKGPVSVTVP